MGLIIIIMWLGLGAVAGLLVSIPLGIGLAVPVFLLVPNLLSLHFEA